MAALLKTILFAGLLSLVSARKTYLVKAMPMAKHQPMVRAYACSYCFVKNNHDNFCFDYLLNIEIGWKWYQENVITATTYATLADVDHYRARFELYTK